MFKFLKRAIERWLNKESPAPDFPQSDFERLRYGLRPGDVLLVEGRTRVSEVIKLITQSRWSHAALYIGRLHDIESEDIRQRILQHATFEPSEQLIIEGLLGQGTVVNKLSDYQRDNLRICRPSALSHGDAKEVVNYASQHLGTPYNFRQMLDLARLLFPWSIVPRRWRSSLFTNNVGEPTRTVCSSMLAEAFGQVNYPVLPKFKKVGKDRVELIKRNTKLFTPADFDYSPYFKVIKFPFWGQVDNAHYRALPWNKDGLMSNDEDDFTIG
ncbi:YiiX/YebB-like N1pC/P60 family cysteine hydrolase [Pleionea litopenaei]|uniref:YiiX/YebB-like N1pC/P60 family cysteine hydrolase n=1 Tax=Pleionea litopenaei TaxID=3070815 RepID=A0AA51RVK5_9GAMM|nr:YiiX/YebB-like N1pC/P60 family cysteine hydrolase [Pleionea sp. HL-JVS1]WMS88310.1 YiiX/YebB-like N1pC/P60 family cysteine hydrolase [Pleionea sp. HL-JVS1]